MNTPQQSSFCRRVRACADELARGDVAALGPLFDLTAQHLVRYALTLCRNQHDAEDAIQAALVRVAMHPRRLATANYPWPYLLRIVRNEALTIVRRQRRRLTTSLHDVACNDPDVSAQKDLKREVWKAIGQLPPPQAEVVVLKIWEEMTFAEIGRVLNTSANTVASRYQYAMAKLARLLQTPSCEVSRD